MLILYTQMIELWYMVDLAEYKNSSYIVKTTILPLKWPSLRDYQCAAKSCYSYRFPPVGVFFCQIYILLKV